MADQDTTTQTEADKLEAQAREDRQKQFDAEEKARIAALSPEEKRAEAARVKADTTESKAVEARGNEAADNAEGATSVRDVKSVSDKVDSSLDIGDHYVQTFANTPENPAPAPSVLRKGGERDQRLEITDSDHPDPANPKVTYVHEDEVGDYLRAGWRRPVA